MMDLITFINNLKMNIIYRKILVIHSYLDAIENLAEEDSCYILKFWVYVKVGDEYFEKRSKIFALINYSLAKNVAETINDQKKIAECYEKIAMVFKATKDTANTLRYFNKAEKTYEETADSLGLASVFLNYGKYYGQAGNFDKSFYYLQKALKIFKEYEDKINIVRVDNDLQIIIRNLKTLIMPMNIHTTPQFFLKS